MHPEPAATLSQRARLLALIGGRLGLALATVAGSVALALALLHAAPGDPIDLLPNGEELRPVLEERWNLNQPLWRQYLGTLGGLLTGDWGVSLTHRPGAPVLEVLAGPALRSLTWLLGGVTLAVSWGLGLALFTEGRSGTWRRAVQVVSVAPVFLLAHLSVDAFNRFAVTGMDQKWFGRPSWFAMPDQDSTMRTALAVVLLAVGSGTLTQIHSEMEGAIRRVRASGWVDAARARGQATWPHVWPHLTLTLATVTAAQTAYLLGGLVILEQVLMLKGAGWVLWQAALGRDYPVALGFTAGAATCVAATRFAADLVRLGLDPRLREDS